MLSRNGCGCGVRHAQREFESGLIRLQPEALEFTNEWVGELVGETQSSEYVRWVQQSLNRLMGLRLAVDGVAG